MDNFASYDAAVTWLKSIGGHVGPVARQADAVDSVTVFDAQGLTRTSTFREGAQRDYREAVRLACCELYEAVDRPSLSHGREVHRR